MSLLSLSRLPSLLSVMTILTLWQASSLHLTAADKTVAVNDYIGIPYKLEPVSFDWELPEPTKIDTIGLQEGPYQVEILDGTPEAVRKARIWTLVDFPFIEKQHKDKLVKRPGTGAERHKLLTLTTAAPEQQASPPFTSRPDRDISGIALHIIDNGRISIRVPAASQTFDPPISAFHVPGPVCGIGRSGEELVGAGYLHSLARVSSLTCTIHTGPVFIEHHLRYDFDNGKHYACRVRLYPNKQYVYLNEDFNLGGADRFIFSYEDWLVDSYFKTRDANRYGWQGLDESNPAGDFIRIAGQKALSRLVVWSQFNYFRGKQETIGLKAPDPAALPLAHEQALQRWDKNLKNWESKQEQWKSKPPRGGIPPKPVKPVEPRHAIEDLKIAGTTMPVSTPVTPAGSATAIGAFYIRPDRWTRAALNHVDLYIRPEVPGDRRTRGRVGSAGARLQPAMEAWLVEGHREWAMFAVPAADRNWLITAHVREGVWPLDRLNRLPLVWNSDGSPVDPAATVPDNGTVGGCARTVLLGTGGRSGLQYFNGSNPHIRGRYAPFWDGKKETSVSAQAGANNEMVGMALNAYIASDDSSYPSIRAMLPWTDPEALNPFYQGMENMNFNADLYRWIFWDAIRLAERKHPDAERFMKHAEQSFDMALDRYVYPQSGCWEESHGYAGHTLKVVTPLANGLKACGRKNFWDDPRLAKMLDFFVHAHSPIDLHFGNRVIAPIGDHGLSTMGPAERLGKFLTSFAGSKDEATQTTLANIRWLIDEAQGKATEQTDKQDAEQEARQKPPLSSCWLQGYGSVLRGTSKTDSLVTVTLQQAVTVRPGKKKKKPAKPLADIHLVLPWNNGTPGTAGSVYMTAYGRHRKDIRISKTEVEHQYAIDLTIKPARRSAGASGQYLLTLPPDKPQSGTYTGTFTDGDQSTAVSGSISLRTNQRESMCIVRAGQSWGHHHADKGSLWFWGRNCHFFGDCGWGSAPGGTYGNPFKQGPASGTQLELVGINNWTLPCKYPAPWIAEQHYGDGFDYVLARNLYPYNPGLDLSRSTGACLTNGYDRQVAFVHPDLLIVRDNIESNCPIVWRLHSYHKEGTTVDKNRASIDSKRGVIADLNLLQPAGLQIDKFDAIPDKHPVTGAAYPAAGQTTSSSMLRTIIPQDRNLTWSVITRGRDQNAKVESWDADGRVTYATLGDGREVVICMANAPFTWKDKGYSFSGRVGIAITDNGKTTCHTIDAEAFTGP